MKKKKSNPNQVNLFDALKHMTTPNPAFFAGLTDDQVKSLSPFVLMLWARGAESSHDYHNLLTNEYVNPHAFSLSKHPRLLYKLLCIANGGYGQTRYSFGSKRKSGGSTAIKTIMAYYDYSPEKARQVLSLFSEDDVEQMSKELGDD